MTCAGAPEAAHLQTGFRGSHGGGFGPPRAHALIALSSTDGHGSSCCHPSRWSRSSAGSASGAPQFGRRLDNEVAWRITKTGQQRRQGPGIGPSGEAEYGLARRIPVLVV